jgi:DNA-binding transcriptional regulator YiaG
MFTAILIRRISCPCRTAQRCELAMTWQEASPPNARQTYLNKRSKVYLVSRNSMASRFTCIIATIRLRTFTQFMANLMPRSRSQRPRCSMDRFRRKRWPKEGQSGPSEDRQYPAEYDAKAIRSTRDRIGVSQAVFAGLTGISVVLVRAWEQGQRTPAMWARRLFDEMNRDPVHWRSMLRRAS